MKHPDLLAIEGVEVLGEDACFHDAEVLRLELKREREVTLTLDFVLPRGERVMLIFDDVEDVRFDGFNNQNALFDVTIEKSETSLRVALNPAYGLGGEFTCSRARVADGSQHL